MRLSGLEREILVAARLAGGRLRVEDFYPAHQSCSYSHLGVLFRRLAERGLLARMRGRGRFGGWAYVYRITRAGAREIGDR
jgi:hypothetical protein